MEWKMWTPELGVKEERCPDGVTPICRRDVRGHKASDWLRTAGACLRQLPTMRLSLTGSPLERSESGRVRTGRMREAGDGAAEPRQQPAARMETGVKFACASLARTVLFNGPNNPFPFRPDRTAVPHARLLARRARKHCRWGLFVGDKALTEVTVLNGLSYAEGEESQSDRG